MHFKEKFECFLKNGMEEENADRASLSWKNRRSQGGTGWNFPTCCLRLSCRLHVCVQLLSYVQLFTAPWTVAHQAPLSMAFFRQEYRNGLPFPFSGDQPRDQTHISSVSCIDRQTLPLSRLGSCLP